MCWTRDKLIPSISSGFYSRTSIFRVIITAYRRPYGGTPIAQTTGDRVMFDTQ
jgi:hypothetical protein